MCDIRITLIREASLLRPHTQVGVMSEGVLGTIKNSIHSEPGPHLTIISIIKEVKLTLLPGVLAWGMLICPSPPLSHCVSHTQDRREQHQSSSLPFFEVFVDIPLEVCEQRDVKGLYMKACAGIIIICETIIIIHTHSHYMLAHPNIITPSQALHVQQVCGRNDVLLDYNLSYTHTHPAGYHTSSGGEWSTGALCPSRPADSCERGGQQHAPALSHQTGHPVATGTRG